MNYHFLHYRSAEMTDRDVFNKKVGRTIASGRIQAFLDGRPSEEIQVIALSDMDA